MYIKSHDGSKYLTFSEQLVEISLRSLELKAFLGNVSVFRDIFFNYLKKCLTYTACEPFLKPKNQI